MKAQNGYKNWISASFACDMILKLIEMINYLNIWTASWIAKQGLTWSI